MQRVSALLLEAKKAHGEWSAGSLKPRLLCGGDLDDPIPDTS